MARRSDRAHDVCSGGGTHVHELREEGYTEMPGWDHRCNVGKIPTKYAIDDEARLIVEFRMGAGCPTFKYVFAGPDGETYLRAKGAWEKRTVKVVLRGNRVEEEKAIAKRASH